MPETPMTETPQTPTEGSTSSEASSSTLLSGTVGEGTTQQSGDPAKPAAETAKPAEGQQQTETKTEPGAPEKYEFTAPDGTTYDPAVVESFSEAAKAANLTQGAAQKMLEAMAPKMAERQLQQVQATVAGWEAASKSDKEFGGEKLQENLAVANKALKAYASPELLTLLKSTGFANHPEVIRLMVKVGQSVKEDGFVGGQAATPPKSLTSVMYDNTPSKG
jgi:hypothetical protein